MSQGGAVPAEKKPEAKADQSPSRDGDASKIGGGGSPPRSRRTFVKAALVGGAAAAAVGAGWTFLLSPRLRPSDTPSGQIPPETPPPVPYGTYVIWFDTNAGVFRRRSVATGQDEVAGADGAQLLQDAIASLAPPTGGEIWLSSTVGLPSSVITIDRDNISLLALRDTNPRDWADPRYEPRPHLQKILYTGNVNGGVLQGIHCREIQFDGTGNQQMVKLRDISMHPTGIPNQQGLRFSGGTGYIQYLAFENLKIVLSGQDSTAIELGNANGGSGHYVFTGITTVEAEYDATGTPTVIKVLPGAETGTPIRFDNLTIVDLPARTAGAGVRPIWMQSQSELSKGLRTMHIGHMFFEQHFATSHSIVTIDPAIGSGACWFGLTIDELVLSDEVGKTINLIDNRNTSWMSRDQYLKVGHGAKKGVGAFSLGTLGLHEHFTVQLLNEIANVTPFGKLATPFTESTPLSFVGPGGTSAAPLPTSEYVVAVRPIAVVSDQPWTLIDANGVGIGTVPPADPRVVPIGYRVQFPSGTPSIHS